MTNKRQEFYKTEDILKEFKEYLKDSDKFDIVTVVGEGEPTLCSNLGELICGLKEMTDKPVAVITNGALLSDPQVREELCHADMVLPVKELGGISIEMLSSGSFFSEIEDDYEAVKSIIGRHPMNQFELNGFLDSRGTANKEEMIEKMKQDEEIAVIDYKGILTFRLR